MIKYSDNARDYIARTKRANSYLANNAQERQANRKLRMSNVVLTLALVSVVIAFISYLPYAMDKTWEQQYENVERIQE